MKIQLGLGRTAAHEALHHPPACAVPAGKFAACAGVVTGDVALGERGAGDGAGVVVEAHQRIELALGGCRGRADRSGDLGCVTPTGRIRMAGGRLRDMLIRGGENVYPREVEEFLFRHPKVAEVQVIGVPDPRFVEEICAWIRLKPGESATPEEIREFCQGQIAHYKIPRHIRFVEEFPMTVTGKVQKYLMREAMIEELGLSEQKTA